MEERRGRRRSLEDRSRELWVGEQDDSARDTGDTETLAFVLIACLPGPGFSFRLISAKTH